MSSAKVVERDAHADLTQARQHVDGAFRVGHHDVFGDLEFERLGRQVAGVEKALYVEWEAAVQQISRTEVDRNREVEALIAALADLRERAAEHELGQRAGQAALLGQRKKLG